MEKLLTSVSKPAHELPPRANYIMKLVIVSEQSSIYNSVQAINNILSIKAFIIAVPSLYEALGAARTDLLTRIREICRPELTQPIADLIANTINVDATAAKSALDMKNQRTYAVKVSNLLLDCVLHIN